MTVACVSAISSETFIDVNFNEPITDQDLKTRLLDAMAKTQLVALRDQKMVDLSGDDTSNAFKILVQCKNGLEDERCKLLILLDKLADIESVADNILLSFIIENYGKVPFTLENLEATIEDALERHPRARSRTSLPTLDLYTLMFDLKNVQTIEDIHRFEALNISTRPYDVPQFTPDLLKFLVISADSAFVMKVLADHVVEVELGTKEITFHALMEAIWPREGRESYYQDCTSAVCADKTVSAMCQVYCQAQHVVREKGDKVRDMLLRGLPRALPSQCMVDGVTIQNCLHNKTLSKNVCYSTLGRYPSVFILKRYDYMINFKGVHQLGKYHQFGKEVEHNIQILFDASHFWRGDGRYLMELLKQNQV